MALDTVSVKNTGVRNGSQAETTTQINNVILALAEFAQRLDADAGVDDTDYASTLEGLVALVVDENGNTL